MIEGIGLFSICTFRTCAVLTASVSPSSIRETQNVLFDLPRCCRHWSSRLMSVGYSTTVKLPDWDEIRSRAKASTTQPRTLLKIMPMLNLFHLIHHGQLP